MLEISLDTPDEIRLTLTGQWTIDTSLNELSRLTGKVDDTTRRVSVVVRELGQWDSALVSFLFHLDALCKDRGADLMLDGIPDGAKRLLELATAVPVRAVSEHECDCSPLEAMGRKAMAIADDFQQFVRFVGDVMIAVVRLALFKARVPRRDLLSFIQRSGPDALGIVTLISLLVGLILAFVGAIQLRMFGAQIYVADLVGIAMVRELGAIMTAIVMAGRTGAAYAAQLGTMQVNDEIDAFRTMGISPIEFLVLPRVLALTITMPLLCVYADLMGLVGGMIVGVGMLDLGLIQYWNESMAAIRMNDFWIGLFMSAIFGVLVSGAGCLRGMQCGRSSAEVGRATTSAVVTGIVAVVTATALITYLCDIFNI